MGTEATQTVGAAAMFVRLLSVPIRLATIDS